tara:strand:- start:3078 stop:3815 length:738 start_codon:yes stop_codon:yes gene_type:complete
MKVYEILYLIAFPLLPAFYNKVRKDILKICGQDKLKIIDIGGRLSPYTIGINGEIIIVDKEPNTTDQVDLHLGLNENKIDSIKHRRSNLKKIILHDMIKPLENMENIYDLALNIEVIEHVREAEELIKNISKVLKSSGVLYLTTPNGDYVKNEPPHYNPDHVKHYTRKELDKLLKKYFNNVEIEYGVKTGSNRMNSLRSWNFRKPMQLLSIWIASILSRIESRRLQNTSYRTAHLFATCRNKIIL